ncbi:hypothetical protein EHS13_10375 [Paenibacillus psychroresistens]|uniref:Uncharacterized protein n=1 Tax=Paenibacillus psychroresistens TaxID=1778678 RepID=A0A6B8RI36_9BACL|nr:DUF2161 family putative PD-(D/E)XK-type phosphodiesterase [Paenibacillus psychroresistens]QGQ95265.1 hypothetical protein EHS13_10375 [Paenibacillus psychroresistens]
MPIQSETELYEPIKQFMEKMGYTVRSEVKHCDVVAIRGDEPMVIIELKKTFNLPLIIQGMDRLQNTDYVYLATEQKLKGPAPYNLHWNDIQRLCKMLGLGLITVKFYKTKKPFVEVLCEPVAYVPRKSAKRASAIMNEFRERSGDYNVGGSSKRKLVTVYREKSLQCATYMKLHGPLTTKQLRELTGNSKVTGLLQKNYYLWFQRVKRGSYGLTAQGEADLLAFAHVAFKPSNAL